jgi:hypothetical protein
MGYVGVAVPSSLYINRVNPAMLSAINTTRIVGDLSYTGFSATGNLGSTYQAFTGFNGAGVAVPIWKTVFATGIYPYSRLDYNQRQIGRLELPETDTTALEYRYRGIGGLSTVPLALAFTPYNNRFRGTIRLGISMNIIFGTTERTRETFFGGALLPQLTNTIEERASGTTFTFGGSYTKPRLFSRTDLLTLGASFTTGSTLNGERRDFISGNGISDTLQSPTNTVTLPPTLALGISYLSDSYLLGLDVVMQNWSAFEYFGEDVSYTQETRFVSALAAKNNRAASDEPGFFSVSRIARARIITKRHFALQAQRLMKSASPQALGFLFRARSRASISTSNTPCAAQWHRTLSKKISFACASRLMRANCGSKNAKLNNPNSFSYRVAVRLSRIKFSAIRYTSSTAIELTSPVFE